ncbi:MAG: glycosyltransferase family 39 protein [bacterium]|nr:glycosyltransferase family 39 protein [bacterium]
MNSGNLFGIFFTKNRTFLIFALGIIFVLIVSFSTLTTKPRISTDEAVSIEIARNFQVEKVLDIKTAPRVYSGFGERLQSTGYPITIPLAWFFNLFGYGLAQARIYMLLWMLGTITFLFWFSRKWFGDSNALFSFFLIITFASFYANGRTVVGEIHGFLFLLVGLYLVFERRQPFWAGIFFGFAVVSKLSVFGLIIPTLVIIYLCEWRKFFQTLTPIAVGMLPAGILWIFLNLSNPFLKSTWTSLFHFYQNPYGSSISENVVRNLLAIPHSTTLIYFGVFLVVMIFVRFVTHSKFSTLYNFVLVYAVLAFMYYLRSPGWLRYVLIAEFLILFLLPQTLAECFKYFHEKLPKVLSELRVHSFVFIFLILLQGLQMFTASDIFSSDGASQAAQSINGNLSGKSVGVLNAVEVAVWLETPSRYLAMDLIGVPQIGVNPLLQKELPEIVVSHAGQRFLVEGKEVIASRYKIYDKVGGYEIYELK